MGRGMTWAVMLAVSLSAAAAMTWTAALFPGRMRAICAEFWTAVAIEAVLTLTWASP